MSERTPLPRLFGGLLAALALGALLWRAAAATPAPLPAVPAAKEAAKAAPAGEFHALDRPKPPAEASPLGCRKCHPAAAHSKKPLARAFLNAHVVELDCSACHAARATLFARFDASGAPSATGGKIFAARQDGASRVPLTLAVHEDGLAPRPPACRECHRRGGTLVSAPGLFDDFRRRLLEDLDLLARHGGAL